jgi:hypothetical protein
LLGRVAFALSRRFLFRQLSHPLPHHLSNLLLTMNLASFPDVKVAAKGADMSGNTAPAKDSVTESSTTIATGAAAPTGYRVSILPGALEVSARLANAEELRNLVKILHANMAIWADSTEDEPPLPLSKRLAKAG